MKSVLFLAVILILAGLLLTPLSVYAETEQPGNPPISQPLVREGALAVKLVDALKLGTASNEAEAESMLAAVGIGPRNGWIADYPVTPDIVGELQSAVSNAADANQLNMGKDEAVKAFQDVLWAYDLSVRPSDGQYADTTSYDNGDSTIINNYYYSEGPPIVTYYAPPPYYYPFYTWVPYPFWWWDFWFPGFFVLIDFHKTVIVDGRAVIFSNHFFDRVNHRVGRINPVSRFHGRTFAGVGASSIRDAISGRAGSGTRNAISGSRERLISGVGRTSVREGRTTVGAPSSSRTSSSPVVTGRTTARSIGDRMINSPSVNRRTSVFPSGRNRDFGTPSVNRRTFASPSGVNRTFSSPPSVSRSFSSPSAGGRTFNSPSVGSRTFAPSSGGRTFSMPSGGGRMSGGTFGSFGGGSRGSFGGWQRR